MKYNSSLPLLYTLSDQLTIVRNVWRTDRSNGDLPGIFIATNLNEMVRILHKNDEYAWDFEDRIIDEKRKHLFVCKDRYGSISCC